MLVTAEAWKMHIIDTTVIMASLDLSRNAISDKLNSIYQTRRQTKEYNIRYIVAFEQHIRILAWLAQSFCEFTFHI